MSWLRKGKIREAFFAGTAFCFVALLISANAAYGQAVFGNIFGTVTDPSGAAVPGAEVTIEDVQRGARYTTATNASGNFTRTNLQAGEYRVMIQAGGFKTFIQDNVTLGVDQAVRVDAVLELGEVAEQITVTEAPPLLKSDRADVSTALNERQVTELPAPHATAALAAGLTEDDLAARLERKPAARPSDQHERPVVRQ